MEGCDLSFFESIYSSRLQEINNVSGVTQPITRIYQPTKSYAISAERQKPCHSIK